MENEQYYYVTYTASASFRVLAKSEEDAIRKADEMFMTDDLEIDGVEVYKEQENGNADN